MASYRICVTVVDVHAGALCSLINSGNDVHAGQTIRESQSKCQHEINAINSSRFVVAKLVNFADASDKHLYMHYRSWQRSGLCPQNLTPFHWTGWLV